MMISQKQLLANRQNALRSTGPKTVQGKAIASQNAIKHGLRAEHSIIPGEDPQEFDQFRQLLLDDLAPIGAMEVFLADRIVTGFWKLRRAGRIETDMIKGLHDEWLSRQRDRQKQIQAHKQEQLEQDVARQLAESPDPPGMYEKVRTAWNNSEQARMIRENRWPRTPGHPSPDEAMRNFIAEYTLKLRKQHQQTFQAEMQHQLSAQAAEAQNQHAAENTAPAVIGKIMQQDMSTGNLLARFRQYEGQIERSLYKALTELQKFQFLRSGICVTEPPDDQILAKAD